MPDDALSSAALHAENERLQQRVRTLEQALDESQRAQGRAERRSAELATIIQSIPEAVYVGTDEGITIANDPALRMVGFQSHNDLNRDLTTLVCDLEKRDATTGERLSAEQTGFARALHGESEISYLLIRHLETGEDRVLRSSTAPVYLHGEIIGAIALHMDVTEQRRTEDEQQFLMHVTTGINTPLDVATRLKQVVDLLVPRLADLCCIHGVTDDGCLKVLALAHRNLDDQTHTASSALLGGVVDPDGPQPVAQAFRTGQTIHYEPVSDDDKQATTVNDAHLATLHEITSCSVLSVPLIARGNTIGVLNLVYNESGRHYRERDIALAEELAWRVALAFDNAQIVEQQARARQIAVHTANRLSRLQRATAALTEHLAFERVAAIVIEQLVNAFEARAGTVMLLTNDGTELEIVYALGYEETDIVQQWRRFSVDLHVPATHALHNNAPVWVESLTELHDHYPDLFAHHDGQSRAWAAIPFYQRERPVGVLGLSFRNERTFSEEDQIFMRAMAQQCSQALNQARLYEAEQQARAAAEGAVHQRDQVFSLISHDLQSPLASIQGYIQILQQRLQQSNLPDVERLERGLNNIAVTIIRITNQVEELLDIASLQAGQCLSFDLAEHDVVGLVQRIIEASRHLSTWHTLRVETNEDHLYCTIDGLRIERVLSNLITNAIKYSPDGGEVRVEVSREQHSEQEYACIRVCDQGMGIPADDLTTIFEPFRRGSNVRSTSAGTGLGLASARQIIEQHGGTILVESTVGEGSVFTIQFPLQMVQS